MRRLILLFVIFAAIIISSIAQAQEQPCPNDYTGYLPPRLQVGGRGQVEMGGSPNRVRSEPNTQAAQIGALDPGTEFEVIAGPSCDSSNMIIWWRIQTENVDGWTAEGLLPDDYFVEAVGESLAETATSAPTFTPTPSRTHPPTPTPTLTLTPLPVEPLPELEMLSPENIAQLELLARFQANISYTPLFTSPTGDYLFIPQGGERFPETAIVYQLPDLSVWSQQAPVDFRDLYYTEADHSAFFTPDGGLMVSVFDLNNYIAFYQPREDNLIVKDDFEGYVTASALSTNGILAAMTRIFDPNTGNERYWLHLFDPFGETYAPEMVFSIEQSDEIFALAFIGDSTQLVAATESQLILYEAITGEVIDIFNYGTLRTGAMALLVTDQDQLPIVFLSQQDYLLSVDLETGTQRTYPIGVGYIADRIEFTPDGKTMMVIADSPELYTNALFINIETKAIVYQENMRIPITSAELHPSETLVHLGFRFFNTMTWEEIHRIGANYGDIRFSEDGKLVLARNFDMREYHILGVPVP